MFVYIAHSINRGTSFVFLAVLKIICKIMFLSAKLNYMCIKNLKRSSTDLLQARGTSSAKLYFIHRVCD